MPELADMAYSINSFPTVTTTTHNVQHPSTPTDNIKMPQTHSTTTAKNQGDGSPPWSMGSMTCGQHKHAMSMVENKGMQQQKSKTNVGEEKPSKGGKKAKKPTRKKPR